MKCIKCCLELWLAGALAAGVLPETMAAITLLDGVPWVYEVKADRATILHGPGSGGVSIPSKLDGYSVWSIGSGAFSGCSGLTSVTIPDGVTRIEDYGFYGCGGLKEVRIPRGIPYIENGVFGYCSGLTNIVIPDSVTAIEDSAFYECNDLRSLTIPDSVRSIGSVAFCGCYRLTDVTIPNSVKNIGDYAFSGCLGLTNMTIGNSVTNIGKDVFRSCNSLKTLNVPSWWETKYASEIPWSVHAGVPPECEVIYYEAEEPAEDEPVLPMPESCGPFGR